MKAQLTFDLSDPDDVLEHLKAVNAPEMALFIWNLKHNTIRKIIKDDLTFMEAMELIEDKLNELPFDIDELVR